MKKFTCTLFVIISCIVSYAQVQLLHSFSNVSQYNHSHLSFETISEPVDCYVIVEGLSIHIYNSNFVLEKTITFNLSDFSWHPDFHPNVLSSMDVSLVGRHLINTDDKIEMIVNVSANEIWYNEYGDECSRYDKSTSTIIVNEDGDIVHDFGYNVYPYVELGIIYGFHKIGNQLRLAVCSSEDLNIYSLGGNYNPSTMVTYTQPGSFPNPYPNPSRNIITIPYTLPSGETSQLRVFNMNGQLVETFNIGSDFDKIQINVSNYSKGTYIYTYNNVTKKFVVQ